MMLFTGVSCHALRLACTPNGSTIATFVHEAEFGFAYVTIAGKEEKSREGEGQSEQKRRAIPASNTHTSTKL